LGLGFRDLRVFRYSRVFSVLGFRYSRDFRYFMYFRNFRFRILGIAGIQDSRILGFRIPGFQGSRIQGSRISRIPGI